MGHADETWEIVQHSAQANLGRLRGKRSLAPRAAALLAKLPSFWTGSKATNAAWITAAVKGFIRLRPDDPS